FSVPGQGLAFLNCCKACGLRAILPWESRAMPGMALLCELVAECGGEWEEAPDDPRANTLGAVHTTTAANATTANRIASPCGSSADRTARLGRTLLRIGPEGNRGGQGSVGLRGR